MTSLGGEVLNRPSVQQQRREERVDHQHREGHQHHGAGGGLAHALGAATATVDGVDAVRVVLDERLRGVAPGQSVVLYEGTRVVGSATISGTGRA